MTLFARGEINGDQVLSYLRRTGWHREPAADAGPMHGWRLGERASYVSVPSRVDFRDYDVRLQFTVRDLAEVENRSLFAVMRDIAQQPATPERYEKGFGSR